MRIVSGEDHNAFPVRIKPCGQRLGKGDAVHRKSAQNPNIGGKKGIRTSVGEKTGQPSEGTRER